MAGYWIVTGTVKDESAYAAYAEAWAPIARRYRARMLAGGGRHQVREGPERARVAVVEFPSYEEAVACYDDPEYQAALAHARRAYARDLVIVEGA